MRCHRSGRVTCPTCQRSGQLKWFVQLQVKFENNTDDFIKKSELIPDEDLRTCLAKNIFSEKNRRVSSLKINF